MDDLDALLADLQSTTAHLSSHQDNHLHRPYTSEFNNLQPVSTDVHKYYRQDDSSPTQRTMKEVTVTTTTYHPNSGPSPALNSNLSELDSLLEDLSSSKYSNYSEKKAPVTPCTNGPASRHKSISPAGSVGSNEGLQEFRPTVESLLDELQSAVPSHSPRHPERQVITTVTTKTTHHRPPSPATPQRPVSPVTTYRPTSPASNYPTASSATKELDDLMASLSDFKITSAPAPSHATITTTTTTTDSLYAKPNKPKTPGPPPGQARNNDHLDSMLGTLQSDMSRQGINTAQKGCCAACGKPIVGQVVTALAKTWHPEHFTCVHCQQELGTKNFFERDGQPYCESDYHNLFSPRCAYCNGPILDKCVSALDKTWHPEHFFCAQCGNQFGEEGFHEKDGKPYCKADYFEMFAPKCGGCNRPIMENYISALNTQWHPECFVCRDCQTPFNGGSFFDHEGMPYCETHYHAKRGSLCAGCHKPITGRCITAMFRKFHPEHFVCSFCLKQLNKGTFKEQNDKPYCHACFEKLFG